MQLPISVGPTGPTGPTGPPGGVETGTFLFNVVGPNGSAA